MYTATFYSFKGGVGRSMALVNVAMGLARFGRRVFLIDFDLEAPGLVTFGCLKPENSTPGVVEYIDKYLQHNLVDDIDKYTYKAPNLGEGMGDVWIMPAGREDANYRDSLGRINWLDLYENHKGFLFIENLKYQIEKAYKPDYLLIDSRTGHSDVEGICTRQLPDAVVALFFPNEQNLNGLDLVCQNIRSEKKFGIKKDIKIHFVMSNVPDLDDEHEILTRKLLLSKRKLKFSKLAATINHYNSLTLLDQSVFIVDRPSTKLAKQYKKLVEALMINNIADRTGSMAFLDRVNRNRSTYNVNSGSLLYSNKVEQQIQSIGDQFVDDPGIQFAIAKAYDSSGNTRAAEDYLTKLLANRKPLVGVDLVDVRLERARIRVKQGDKGGAAEDLLECFGFVDLGDVRAINAARLLIGTDVEGYGAILESPAVWALNQIDKYVIAELSTKIVEVWTSDSVVRQLIRFRSSLEVEGEFELELFNDNLLDLALLYINQGAWSEAISSSIRMKDRNSVASAFNIAMSTWGDRGHVDSQTMLDCLHAAKGTDDYTDANYSQCMSIVEWAVGDLEKSINHLGASMGLAKETAANLFSCWQYRCVTPSVFVEDCIMIKRMIEGEDLRPDFVNRFMKA